MVELVNSTICCYARNDLDFPIRLGHFNELKQYLDDVAFAKNNVRLNAKGLAEVFRYFYTAGVSPAV